MNGGTLVWSEQIRSISSKLICLENNHKISHFLPIAFWWSLPQKFPRNRPIFPEFVPKNPAKFDFSSATCQKPCLKINASSVRWSFYLFSTTVLLINMYWYCCWSILGLERLTSPCSNISKERVRLNKKCVQTFFCDMNSS